MDPEQTFLRVHARLSGMLSQLLTPRIRLALEYLYLAGAVALFCLLVVMHTNFVQQPGCSSEFTGIEFGEAQLVQIKIISGGLWASKGASYIMDLQNLGRSAEKILEVNGDKFNVLASKFLSTWVGPGARRRVPELKTTGEGSVHHPLSAKESIKAAATYLSRKWYSRAALFWRNIKQVSDNALQLMVRSNWDDFLHLIKDLQLPSMDHLLSNIVKWFEKRSKSFEPTYLYGVEKGYFLLSEVAKNSHGVRTINITISARNPCFGNRWQQLLINSIVGYDTILTNSLVNSPGQGYLYNFQTKELYDLSYGHEPPTGPTRFGDYFVTKCGVLLMSLFVFFTTTMSVSFTLRETQSRMLRFTGLCFLL
uniref:Membralin n=1 Tax=Aegilops tauschii subsp. strangulata TaxID=200361 RepID=A0A453H0Z2_AEGTS